MRIGNKNITITTQASKDSSIWFLIPTISVSKWWFVDQVYKTIATDYFLEFQFLTLQLSFKIKIESIIK